MLAIGLSISLGHHEKPPVFRSFVSFLQLRKQFHDGTKTIPQIDLDWG